MDRMINSAPTYSGGISDSAYDRSEDAVTKMQTCEDCDGHGVVYFCGECDVLI
jgi:DnaJ-class molecular chaperone